MGEAREPICSCDQVSANGNCVYKMIDARFGAVGEREG